MLSKAAVALELYLPSLFGAHTISEMWQLLDVDDHPPPQLRPDYRDMVLGYACRVPGPGPSSSPVWP